MSSLGRKKKTFDKKKRNRSVSENSGIPPMPSNPPPRPSTKMKSAAMGSTPAPYSLPYQCHNSSHSAMVLPRFSISSEQPEQGASYLGRYSESHETDLTDEDSPSYLIPIDSPGSRSETGTNYGNRFFNSSVDLEMTHIDGGPSGGPYNRIISQRFDSGMVDSVSDHDSNHVHLCSGHRSMAKIRNGIISGCHYVDIDQVGSDNQQQHRQQGQRVREIQTRLAATGGVLYLSSSNNGEVPCLDGENDDPVVNIPLAELISSSRDTSLSIEEKGATLPHTYTQLNTRKVSGTASVTPLARGSCCGLVTFISFLLITLAVLTVTMYILFFRTDLLDDNTVSNLTQILADLRYEIDNLKQKQEFSSPPLKAQLGNSKYLLCLNATVV